MANNVNQIYNLDLMVQDVYDTVFNRYTTSPPDNLGGIITRISTQEQKIVDHFVGDIDTTFIEDTGQDTETEVDYLKISLECKKYKAKNGLRIWREESIPKFASQHQDRVRKLFQAAVQLPNLKVIQAIEAGQTTKAPFDNVNYFSAATGKRKITNLKTNGSGTSLNQLEADLNEVQAAFQRFKSEDHYTNAYPNTILAPVELAVNFQRLQQSTATAEENINSNVRSVTNVLPRFNLVTTNLLENKKNWYLFDTNLKPMIWAHWLQENNGSFVDIRLMDELSAYNKQGFKEYNVSIWGGAQYGLPYGAYKIVNP